MVVNPSFWGGKKVFLTGHTGFKGSWLSLWIQQLGAEVTGYALPPPTNPSLFDVACVEQGMRSIIGDIRDGAMLVNAMREAVPEIVIHMAAQPLVRLSYVDPVETYSSNIMGTVHLLEAVRQTPSVRAVVNVTTDKCYENQEWIWGYRESEPLGGRDPYSSSKACSELVTAAYRDSFFKKTGVAIATGRAGNVIGGGDWALDRLLPDFFRAFDDGRVLDVRLPNATRPWQHVLEPLSGYLLLAEQLLLGGQRRASGWNFGPADEDARSVRWILDHLKVQLPDAAWQNVEGEHVHEAGYLKLDSSKARSELGWRPQWQLARALEMTVEWHKSWREGRDMREVCLAQIRTYQSSRQD
jgi:CDP-glucose 4,6-dehydratase